MKFNPLENCPNEQTKSMADEEHLAQTCTCRGNCRIMYCLLFVLAATFVVGGQAERLEKNMPENGPGERGNVVLNPGGNVLGVEITRVADDSDHVMVTSPQHFYDGGKFSTIDPLVTAAPTVNRTTTSIPPATFIPPASVCLLILKEFGRAASHFTSCAVVHSRPFRFCEDCVHQYVSLKQYYEDILNHSCGNALLKQDRIVIVQQTYDFAVGLWSAANCDGCFQKSNGTINYDAISEETTHFQSILNDTTKCFANNSDEYVPQLFTMPVPSSLVFSTVNDSVCNECQGLYKNLSEYFRDMGLQEEICMDVVDAMNYTQYLWSKEFHCREPVRNPVLIIALSVFFCSLPVFFYVGSKIHTTRIERKLVKRKLPVS
ncbi:osteopetrosis-associated transmembrane protein 1-like [Ptychodera flava]|uniref:osteopetrosis-associated transmembrane protein 1-like n=1 Tax=Ptychodera flava TaxID=63121 RepID=UPI00396AA0D8